MKALLRRLSRGAGEQQLLEAANRLFDSGQVFEAIETLTVENRVRPSATIEQRLMELRHQGFFRVSPGNGHSAWPPIWQPSPFDTGTVPSVTRSALSAATLAQGIWGHGALIVRNLLSDPQIGRMKEAIDRAYAAYDAGFTDEKSDEAKAWFTPMEPCAACGPQKIARKWVRGSGGVLAADSPRGFFRLTETLMECGILPVLSEYLGERPSLSVKKTTLRRVSPRGSSGWHQDGAFLGHGIRTVNLWIALTDCGVDAPSMDMLPARLKGIIPTGTGDATFHWSVDDDTVASAIAGLVPERLHFSAGDAILFDETNMHRTAIDPGMTRDRYAIEAWFFAPSRYPVDQIPILC